LNRTSQAGSVSAPKSRYSAVSDRTEAAAAATTSARKIALMSAAARRRRVQ
jgi:hypothetical protein